jgi:hypothetical protein
MIKEPQLTDEQTVLSDRIGVEPSTEQIAERAYELFEARGRQPGVALDDWLQAERELRESTRNSRDQKR